MPVVGVLALQGDFREHVVAVKKAMNDDNFPVSLVKTSEDLIPITHLIIPGGESTVMNKLSIVHQPDNNLREMIIQKHKEGMKIFGVCAGVVLVSSKIENQSENDRIDGLGFLDITTGRNAYGSQVDSFETKLQIKELNPPDFHGVFIRAPLILSANSPEVEVLSTLKGAIVVARNESVLVCSFHPELTADSRLHKLFLMN